MVTVCRVPDSKLTPLRPSLSQPSCSQKCTKKSALHLAEDLFVASEGTSRAGRETLPYLDDDIPLLSVEEEPGMCLLRSATRVTTLTFLSWSFSGLFLSFLTFKQEVVLPQKVVGSALSCGCKLP